MDPLRPMTDLSEAMRGVLKRLRTLCCLDEGLVFTEGVEEPISWTLLDNDEDLAGVIDEDALESPRLSTGIL